MVQTRKQDAQLIRGGGKKRLHLPPLLFFRSAVFLTKPDPALVLLRRKTAAASASAPDVPTASKALPASSLSLSPVLHRFHSPPPQLATFPPANQAGTHAPPRTVISVRERIFPPSSGACVAREEEEGMEEEEVKRRTRVSQQKRDLPTPPPPLPSYSRFLTLSFLRSSLGRACGSNTCARSHN